MTEPDSHASHPAIATRLKRAEGHQRHVIAMIEEGRRKSHFRADVTKGIRIYTALRPAFGG